MRKKKVVVIILSILFAVLFCIKSKEASIEYMIARLVYQDSGSKSDMIFSEKSGFYNEQFELRIFAPTKEIYYTLDGSEPDKNSRKYEESIPITDASNNPNLYSTRTDVSTRFSDKIDEEYVDLSKEPEYVVPDDNIDKCSILKAVYYDQYGNRSNVEEAIYFVGFNNKEGYENVGIISITTEPDNLFDYEEGIYVTGKYFDEYSLEGIPESKLGTWEHWEANYRQRGTEWEKESNIQIFDKNKSLVLSQKVGIRIQGGASRGFYPKSLNIYARDEHGANRLYYDFWGTGYIPKRMTLTTGGNDYYTKIRDPLTSELAKDCNIATMHYEPYVLFLNGEYWGFYYLTEKYDAQYIEYYYDVARGIEEENIIIVKNGEIENGSQDAKNRLYDTMMEFIGKSDMSVDENYQKACELIDIESFIDYFAVESYIARCGDWPKSNYALWRTENVGNRPYEDGKWRWMLFDVNSRSMKHSIYDMDYIEENRLESELFNSLCENNEFKCKFSNRIQELSDTIFDAESVNQKITEYVEIMDKPMEKHFQRFFGTSNDLFHSGVEDIRAFFDDRKPYIAQMIENHFGEEYLGEKQ